VTNYARTVLSSAVACGYLGAHAVLIFGPLLSMTGSNRSLYLVMLLWAAFFPSFDS